MKTLPLDIEVHMTEDGVYIELEGFIRFLKNTDDMPSEYQEEVVHLRKIGEYLESQLSEFILQKQLLSGQYNKDKPN